MKQQRVCVFVVFVDHVARVALDPIVKRLDSFNTLLMSMELSEVIHVQRFLCSDNIDSLDSVSTARQLAVGAYRLTPDGSADDATRYIALAISETIGGRGHLVVHSRQATHQCTFQLPGDPPESSSIELLRSLVVDALGREVGRAEVDDTPQGPQPAATWSYARARPHWQALVVGQTRISGEIPDAPVLFPGSFHPIHQGHRQMAALAATRLQQPVYLEISVTNADKPALDFLTIGQRVRQAESIGPVVLTQAPKFADKAQNVFPGATFLIGADTAMRLDDVRFYEGSETERDAAIGKIADQGCRFLVFGRLVEQRFRDAAQLRLTTDLRKLCDFVPATDFRVDVSSRELRRNLM